MNTLESSYCGQVVKDNDPDRFLLSHFARDEHREALWTLFAFNYEIAKTREIVSETQLGMIRLQWWRDAIAGIYDGQVLDYEVLQSLAKVIEVYDLPREPFDTLIYAREFDLEDVLPGDVEGMLHYVDFTSTPLMQLVAKVLGAEADPIQVVASNYALIGVLRATVSFAKQRRCYLPQDLMTHNGVSVNQLYALKKQDGLAAVIEALAGEFVTGVRCDNRFMRASQRSSEIYLKQLKRLDYNVFNPRMTLPPAFKELRLLLSLC